MPLNSNKPVNNNSDFKKSISPGKTKCNNS